MIRILKTAFHPGPWFMISVCLSALAGDYFSAAFCGAASVVWMFD
jgi:hypothetical protein